MPVNGSSVTGTNQVVARKPAGVKWFDRYTVLVLLILMMVGSLVVSGGWLRYNEYVTTQENLAQSAARSVADELNILVRELRRSVRLFSLEKVDLISELAENPSNTRLQSQLRRKLKTHFPEYFAVAVTDQTGLPVSRSLADGVGTMCQANLKEFVVGEHPQRIVIHPSKLSHHFDVMAHWRNEFGASGVFFVSFKPEMIARILENATVVNHQFFLVKRGDDSLIEVSANGSRDKLSRSERLTAAELERVLYARPVGGTMWDVVDIPNEHLFSDFAEKLIWEESLVLLLFGFVSLLMLYLVKRETLTRDQALAISREKSEFLSTMSHEIRTPLNSVIGFAELLGGTSLDVRQREYVDSVKSSGETLLNLINDILDLSKIDADKLVMEQHEFGLRGWLDGIMRLFSEQANAKGLELAAVIPHDLPDRITGDPTHLQQILVNLIGNAIKFTEKGSVVLRVSHTSLKEESKEEQCVLKFSVLDTGIGINPEQKAHLFDHFTQADDSTTRQYGGTGLGLAISLKLVGLMDGVIDVDSRLKGGSEFWFSVPLKCQEDRRIAQCKAFGTPNGQPLRALLIETSSVYAELLGEHLQRLGCHYERVSAGAEGLMALRNALHGDHPFDFVVSSLQNTDFGGVDLSRLIEADASIRGVPLILMGSMADEEAVNALQEPGVSALLHKPTGLMQVMTAIADALKMEISDSFSRLSVEKVKEVDAGLEGVRILVVDDNEMNLRVASGMLKLLSCEVHTAASGKGALNMAREMPFDLVFMDCEMPEMDGFEATSRLKQMGIDHDGRKTPVVAMTANAVAGDRERCLLADFDDYLPKPITIRTIKDMLLKWNLSAVGVSQASAEGTWSGSGLLVVNEQVLDQMRDLVSEQDPDFFVELMRNFREESVQRLQEIKQQIRSKDSEAIRQALHSLKGTAGLVGAQRLEKSCEDALVDARAGILVDMPMYCDSLSHELDQVLENLPGQ